MSREIEEAGGPLGNRTWLVLGGILVALIGGILSFNFSQHATLATDLGSLSARIEALERDRQRLDALERQVANLGGYLYPTGRRPSHQNGNGK